MPPTDREALTDAELASKLDTLAHETGRYAVTETLLIQEAADRLRTALHALDGATVQEEGEQDGD